MSEDQEKYNAAQQEREEDGSASAAPGRRLRIAAIVFFSVMVASVVYALHERAQAARLASDYRQMSSSLNATQTELADLSAKLQAATAPRENAQPLTPTPVAAQTGASSRTRSRTSAHRQREEDPRWKKVQSELAEHQKQIEATRQDLNSARADLEGKLNSAHDELNGSIARNHDQLAALQKRGERLYYEFDLSKSKRFQRVGPIMIALRKASAKHLYCNFKLLVDDNVLTKKHVSLYEPVEFYPADYGQPLQIVIYEISRNQARGYVSAPRYRESEQAAQSVSDGTAPAEGAQPASAKTANLERRPVTPQ